MNKSIFYILLLFITCQVSFAQIKKLDKIENTKANAESAMKAFFENQIEKGFEIIDPYFPISATEKLGLKDQTVEQLPTIEESFGKKIDYKLIKEIKISDVLVKYIFVVRFELHMMKFQYTYYNSGKGWILNSFKWDDKISELFDNK